MRARAHEEIQRRTRERASEREQEALVARTRKTDASLFLSLIHSPFFHLSLVAFGACFCCLQKRTNHSSFKCVRIRAAKAHSPLTSYARERFQQNLTSSATTAHTNRRTSFHREPTRFDRQREKNNIEINNRLVRLTCQQATWQRIKILAQINGLRTTKTNHRIKRLRTIMIRIRSMARTSLVRR